MASVFESLSRAERRAQQAAYLEFLKQRDGAPDRKNRILAHREAWFRALDDNKVRWEREAPIDEFRKLTGEGGGAAVSGASALGLWMAIVATSNEGEKYSVDLVLEKRGSAAVDPEDPMTYVELEEIYHTRLLLYALDALGVSYQVKTPPWFVRAFAWALTRMPRPLEYVIILWAEVIGTVLFHRLGEKARELVDPKTAAGARVAALLDDILIDEVGHVGYARTHLGPVRLWIVKQLVRLVAGPMYRGTPAIAALFDTRELAAQALALDLTALPEHIRAAAFVPGASKPEAALSTALAGSR